MATRKIIDIEQNGKKVWLKGHAQATFMSDGATVEDTIKSMQTGSGGITSESDPIFSASPAFNITDENIENWNGKQDAILDLEAIRSGASKGATAVQPSELARVATSGDYNDLNNKPAIPTKTSELTNDSTFITSTDNVASATKLQTMRYINGSPFDGTANAVSYAVCTTASATTAKTVSISRFSLATGSQVRVKFNYPNTASAPTLNVGSTGAKRMSYKGNLITNTNFTFNVNKIYTFTYDGTNWVLEGDWDEVPKTNFLTCEFMGEVGDVIWSSSNTDRIAIIHDWMNKLSEGKVSVLESDDDIYAITYALNYRSHETYDSEMARFYYIFEGYLYEVEYDEVALPVTLTIISKTKIGEGEGSNSSGGSSTSGSSAYTEVNHGTSDRTFELTPNTFHVWDEMTALNLTLGAETSGIANEYIFQFTSGSIPTTLTLPDDIKFSEDLIIEANKIYQISILKGLGSALSWDNGIKLTDNYLRQDGTNLVFDYPVTSEVTVSLYGRPTSATGSSMPNNFTLVYPVGSQSMAVGLVLSVNNITPASDDTYNYISTISS